jgi:hypothetical protein
MKRVDRELEAYAKKLLAPLKQVAPLDPDTVRAEKARFLLQAENLRQNNISSLAGTQTPQSVRKPGVLRGLFSLPMYKALAIALLVLVLVAGSSFTVYAAQSSLPGQTLYPVKAASEDVALSLAFSPDARLNLTLRYTNRRMQEIQTLAAEGRPLPDQASDRYQQELDSALQLATQLNNQQMQAALIAIKTQAEDQGMAVGEIIASQPHQASPAMVHLQARLQEQVQLSTIGEANPQEFKLQVQQREHLRRGGKDSSTPQQLESTSSLIPLIATLTPLSAEENPGTVTQVAQPTEMPGKGNPGKGPGPSAPGNGNHGQNSTATPQP